MSLKLQHKLNQNLAISHRLQQSLGILSLSHEELKEAIDKELLENPLLESLETKSEVLEEKGVEKQEELSIPKDYNSFGSFSKQKGNSIPFSSSEEFLSDPVSLKSQALEQLDQACLPKHLKLIVQLFISHLDGKGYLHLDLEKLAIKEKIPSDLLNQGLEVLQTFEPAGLGGRNLEECLLIQLRLIQEDTKSMCLIVKNHLHNLKEKKYQVIAYDLNIPIEEVIDCYQIIQSLNPNPGRNFSCQPTVFIYPDLYIYKQGEDYRVLLNKEDLPKLQLSISYKNSLGARNNLSSSTKKYIKNKMTSGDWFIRSIVQRQETIKKIAYGIINHQRDFFDYGLSHLKPLTMQDLATDVGIHFSTVSRAVSNKYVSTDHGIIALKKFFQKGLLTKTGKLISLSSVKSYIKKCIEEENPQKALSDEQIRIQIYEKFQISLLRRSISQYRTSMGIAPSRFRRLNSLASLLKTTQK